MLPQHHQIGFWQRTVAVAGLTAAGLLLAILLWRLVAEAVFLPWWLTLLTIVTGMTAADFLSGMIHWGADTWGRESIPVLGPRLLHPFRVHHVNPDDFLRRQFIDTNGDVAVIVIPTLLAAHCVPLDDAANVALASFLAAFAGVGLLTNQIHQWAHMEQPPLPVRGLQRVGLMLRHDAHARHHQQPYDANYCIATGWCNRPLAALDFFRRLERLVTASTGIVPRRDDTAFHERSAAGLAGLYGEHNEPK